MFCLWRKITAKYLDHKRLICAFNIKNKTQKKKDRARGKRKRGKRAQKAISPVGANLETAQWRL